MKSLNSLTEEQIKHKLHSTVFSSSLDISPEIKIKGNKQASVLVPFVRQNDAWHILFIRRATSTKDRHSGQVAFVGGKKEAEDTSTIATALRETQEEIGLEADKINILGQLGLHYSISDFEITPIVASIEWPEKFILDPAEVSHTFTLPLDWLADETNVDIRQQQLPELDTSIPVVYFKEQQGELLWGATAKIVLSLITALKSNG